MSAYRNLVSLRFKAFSDETDKMLSLIRNYVEPRCQTRYFFARFQFPEKRTFADIA